MARKSTGTPEMEAAPEIKHETSVAMKIGIIELCFPNENQIIWNLYYFWRKQ